MMKKEYFLTVQLIHVDNLSKTTGNANLYSSCLVEEHYYVYHGF